MPSSKTETGNAHKHAATKEHSFAILPNGIDRNKEQSKWGKESSNDTPLTQLWLGLAARKNGDGSIDVGFACHDGTYSIDFAVHTLRAAENGIGDENSVLRSIDSSTTLNGEATAIADHLCKEIREYQQRNRYKFLGAGLMQALVDLSPQTPTRLWRDFDIVPVVIGGEEGGILANGHHSDDGTGVDELADALARKCLINYGPSLQPRTQIGFRNLVDVDLGGRACLATLEEFQQGVSARTWDTAMKYAHSLKQRNIKFAFFSATPQGGGVALMRHALIRFFRLLGVSCTWYVPKPRPEVFRITKMNHNILQGLAPSEDRSTVDQQETVQEWIRCNADRFWTSPGGPLAARSEGGVDVVVVDDPQMPGVIDRAKKIDPDRPVIFRSHIQVRSDLAAKPETPTAGVWHWLWKSVEHADLFISHPVKEFVPQTVDRRALAYMPATTDWLDGLNKGLDKFEATHYMHELNHDCMRRGMTTLDYPKRDYIAQVARFDPAKGIPDVLASYADFRRDSQYCRGKAVEATPQLIICGHGSVDDTDSVWVLRQTLQLLHTTYSDVKDSVVVMRLGPSDQLLNTILSNARVVLQLSTQEGFEVKVSEALHKGIPVIATKAGGIPLQVQHEKSGYLVEPGDVKAVARHLDTLFSDNARRQAMSRYAATHVSDEVGTVGNAVCWMYLVDKLSREGETVEPMGQWVWDLARNAAGEPRKDGEEHWLPRDSTT